MPSSISRKTIFIICLITFALMIITTLYFIVVTGYASGMSKVLFALIMLIFFAALTIFAIKISTKKFLVYIFVPLISIIVCILWGLYARTAPTSDYGTLFNGAVKMATGTFKDGFDKTNYFYFYNYQLGYATYLAAVMFFFAQKLIWFKLLEIAYIAGSSILIYIIAKKLFDYRIAAVAAVFCSTFIPIIMGSSVLNNQHLSTLLMLIGIYLVLIGKKRSFLCAGIIFALMNMIRPVALIIIIAVVLKILYDMIIERKWLKHLALLGILIFSFYASISVINYAFVAAKVTPTPITQSHIPYFKLAIGIGARHGNIFKIPDKDPEKVSVKSNLESLNFDYAKYNVECVNFIKRKLSDPANTSLFVFNKMIRFLGDRDNQFSFALNEEQKADSLSRNLVGLGHVQYLYLLVFAFLAMILKIKSKSTDLTLLHISFLGFIWAYLFIEAQTRYRYEAYFFLIILAAEAIVFCYDKATQYIRTRKESSINNI